MSCTGSRRSTLSPPTTRSSPASTERLVVTPQRRMGALRMGQQQEQAGQEAELVPVLALAG